MIDFIKNIDNKLAPIWDKLNNVQDLTLLAARLYMANIFFASGWIKFQYLLNDNFDVVVYQFTDVHPLPGLPPEIAAYAGTFGEVLLPVLLALGLFGRIGALGLLAMTAVIEFGVPAEYEISNKEHYVWMMFLAFPLFHGMGRISADYWLAKWVRGQ